MTLSGYATMALVRAMMVFGAVFTDKTCTYCGGQWVDCRRFLLCYISCFTNDKDIEDDIFIFLAANNKDDGFVCPNC